MDIEIKIKRDVDVELICLMGNDAMVVNAAKVSTSGEQGTASLIGEKEAEGLISYLMKNRHGTPFEHGAMTFFVRAPIFVWREWHRHRIGFSYNEESGRYRTLDPVFYLPPRDRPMVKISSEKWKPSSPKFEACESDEDYGRLCENLEASYRFAYMAYTDNLRMGMDPGLARDCLPVGIFSSCWVTCNPRSAMAFLSLRRHSKDSRVISYPLWEIDRAAQQVERIFAKYWPITHGAFVANGRVAP